MIPNVEVWSDDEAGLRKAGVAFFTLRSGKVSARFSYDPRFLASPSAYQISPDLPLHAAGGHTVDVPASFRDSSPDRWGRRLIEKKLRTESHDVPRQLDAVDYLLGVSDSIRQGALRFRTADGTWLGTDASIPPLVELPRLLDASRSVLSEGGAHEKLKLLLDAGSSSLGGARPKTSVVDDGTLLLAKFSHDADSWDVMGLEKTLLDLMPHCGINAPATRLLRFGTQSALLLKRFDREESKLGGTRIPYLSAMSLLGISDGEQTTYLDLLDALSALCGESAIDQMLRRICFSILFNNTDDHLRNHGFLYRGGKWELSPCFDVTINPFQASRQTPLLGGPDDEGHQFVELAGMMGFSSRQIASMVSDILDCFALFEKASARNCVQAGTVNLVRPIIKQQAECLQSAK